MAERKSLKFIKYFSFFGKICFSSTATLIALSNVDSSFFANICLVQCFSVPVRSAIHFILVFYNDVPPVPGLRATRCRRLRKRYCLCGYLGKIWLTLVLNRLSFQRTGKHTLLSCFYRAVLAVVESPQVMSFQPFVSDSVESEKIEILLPVFH